MKKTSTAASAAAPMGEAKDEQAIAEDLDAEIARLKALVEAWAVVRSELAPA